MFVVEVDLCVEEGEFILYVEVVGMLVLFVVKFDVDMVDEDLGVV